MRLTTLATISAGAVLVGACGHSATKVKAADRERIDLSQGVTTNPRAEDKAFKNFKDNWRQFIIASPELALPVVRSTHKEPWQPQVLAECVSSPDAGGIVPQVTLSWNEMGPENPPTRFDLALHHNGFIRNYYSSALGTGRLQRFMLPSNNALAKDVEAVLLTGPGLFPKLMDFRTETLQDRDTKRQFRKETLVLRDLGPGLTYTIRMSRRARNGWEEEKQFAFLTPVCPNSF